ncbi:MAG TPA: GNAT family N-acetyltransferase [Alphaproteobacteria bacterium]|jgi:ribosomal-protein-alanine N-acetyltransferase|nr:GNAT family N-acetyltransferase [Alphaproteobacteria bacterium]
MTDIATERLKLRRFKADDAAALGAMLADPETMKFFPYVAETPAEGRHLALKHITYFERHWQERGYGVWAVTEADGRLIGRCGIRHWESIDDIEVLYLIERSRWGRGYATEVARAALDFGFNQVGLERIAAVTHQDNSASQRVLGKLGLRYIRELEVEGLPALWFSVERKDFVAE